MLQQQFTPNAAEARQETEKRAPWDRPELRRLDAGNAEVAPGLAAPDTGFS